MPAMSLGSRLAVLLGLWCLASSAGGRPQHLHPGVDLDALEAQALHHCRRFVTPAVVEMRVVCGGREDGRGCVEALLAQSAEPNARRDFDAAAGCLRHFLLPFNSR